jgi:hypothetical protein
MFFEMMKRDAMRYGRGGWAMREGSLATFSVVNLGRDKKIVP